MCLSLGNTRQSGRRILQIIYKKSFRAFSHSRHPSLQFCFFSLQKKIWRSKLTSPSIYHLHMKLWYPGLSLLQWVFLTQYLTCKAFFWNWMRGISTYLWWFLRAWILYMKVSSVTLFLVQCPVIMGSDQWQKIFVTKFYVWFGHK